MFDLLNNVDVRPLFPPVAALTNVNTPRVSNVIDLLGFESVLFCLQNGTNTDPNATFAVTLEEADDVAMTVNVGPVPAALLIGTLALAGSTAANDDGKCRKLGYAGNKRFLRMTVTPTGNDAGDWFMAGQVILGHPRHAPTPNPPL